MTKKWFTIRNSTGGAWSADKSEFVGIGETKYTNDADAYDVAVELEDEGIHINLHTNFDGNERISVVWWAK